MNRIIWSTIAVLGLSCPVFAGCASSNKNVTEAPKQSPRERMKSNQEAASDDLDRALGIDKPATAQPATAEPAASQSNAPAPAQASAGTTQPAAAPPAARRQPAPAAGAPSGPVTPQALDGRWKAGKLQVLFGADGTYTWIQARACRKKPCASDTTSGTYTIRRGKLYLNPNEGNDRIVGAKFSAGMLLLSETAAGKDWTLSRR
ncbi:MAG: hypothetical protein VX938_14230 [Myxococcota bacterium]|nr:hypothetical protein [Myxococcota bacterium]